MIAGPCSRKKSMKFKANMKQKRFIWLSLLQVIAILVALTCFGFWAPWSSSLDASEAARRYPGRVDPSWRAVLVNHGNVSEWRLGTPKQNPVPYSFCSAALFAAITFLIASSLYREKRMAPGARRSS
jgi:hypothetical protein